jgi:hypothetical protein
VKSKLRTAFHLSIGLAIGLVAVLAAPAQSTASTGNNAPHGHVCNQSRAMIAGAKLIMSNSANSITTASQDATPDAASVDAKQQQSATVASASSTINPVTGGTASSTAAKAKQAEVPADDPDQLAHDLSTLAGPSAGPDGGPIFIDPAFL